LNTARNALFGLRGGEVAAWGQVFVKPHHQNAVDAMGGSECKRLTITADTSDPCA